MTDYAGIALVITASGTFLTAAISGYIAVTQAKIHKLVNGFAHEKEANEKLAAHAEGKLEGVDQERAHPMVPASSVGEPLSVKVVNPPNEPVPVDPKPKT